MPLRDHFRPPLDNVASWESFFAQWPLWLADDFAVPLELEASYEQACRDLRIA